MPDRIPMTNPIVEMDGDEMTRVIWDEIRKELLLPFVDLQTEYYDLGLPHREVTKDRVTTEAAEATKKWKVAVKCATITPNAERVKEYGLSEMYRSPNGTIRSILDGTVFRTPILIDGIAPIVPGWKKPVTIARHAFGDLYRNAEIRVPSPGKAEIVFTGTDGTEFRKTVATFEEPGVLQGIYNLDGSIRRFAESCFAYALDLHQDLMFAAKDTISKTYDGRFKEIFREVYDEGYRESFEAQGLNYTYTLIDDAVARLMRSEGGFVWACKNYDGDVFSDMLSASFGSLALMTSVLVSPDGCFEYEAAHGTVQRHYYRYLEGETPSTNPVATIFAWSGALRKRGELDGNEALSDFADRMEQAVKSCISEGKITGDLKPITSHPDPEVLDYAAFLRAVRAKLES